MKKNCKIASTFFGERRRYPVNPEETINLLQEMVEKEKSTDAGVHCDTILVNHLLEKDNEKPLEFLDSINGTQLKNGKLITMNRPWDNGEGFGFKSRDYAFKKYQDEYEYWFFVEDDVNFFLDNYYKKCINILERKPHVAFVCTIHNVIAGLEGPLKVRSRKHCHGSIGCTHVRFLKELIEFNGRIPYPDTTHYQDAEQIGEIGCSNIFLQMGYSLARIEENIHDKTNWISYHLRVSAGEQENLDLIEDDAFTRQKYALGPEVDCATFLGFAAYNEYHPTYGWNYDGKDFFRSGDDPNIQCIWPAKNIE